MNPRTLRIVVATLVLCLLVAAAWRSIATAGDGRLLVLGDRVVRGPIRVVIAPWSARRVVAARQPLATDTAIDLGQGSSWPMRVRGEVAIDPDGLDAAARAALAAGLDPAADVARRTPDALAALVKRTPMRELLARPAALADPLRAELSRGLPTGIRIGALEVAVAAPPEQARAAALAAARTAARPPVARVLHIGLDAADWEIVDRLTARGELPNLARLERDGVRADLLPYTPIISPMLWTTMLTGRPPDEHMIDDFVLFTDAAETNPIPMRSTFRKTPALWEILGASGQRSAFVNHWATEPVEELQGVLVSQVAGQVLARSTDPLPAGLVWPADVLNADRSAFWTYGTTPASAVRAYAPKLTDAQIDAARSFFTDPSVREAFKEQNKFGRKMPPVPFLVTLALTSHNVEEIARRMLARPDLGLVSVYFEDLDICGHNFMHLAPPPLASAPPDEVALFGDTVDNCYRQQDAMVGRLVAAAGPDTIVVVHSDHGFQSDTRRPRDVMPFEKGQPVEWHRSRGMFVAAGGPVRRGVRVPDVSIFDVAPTLLAFRGLPPGDNMPGHVRQDLLEPSAAAALPAARVPSWDPLVPPRQYGAGADSAAVAAAQAQAIEQLRGLGYVDVEPAKAAAPAASKEAAAPVEAHPGNVYYRNLGTYLLATGRFDAAEAALDKARELKPLPKTFAMLSEARAGRNDLPGAMRALEEGFAAFPGDMPADAVRWLVELHLRQNDLAGAEQAFARYGARARTEPGIADETAGLLAEAKGDREAAKASFLRALDADPRASRAAEHFAGLAASPAERAKLEPYLVRGLREDHRLDLYWQMLGMLYAERGDAEQAAQAFHQAAQLVPSNDKLLQSEAAMWVRAGRPDAARRAYEQLAAGGTKSPTAWGNLGTLRAQARDWRGALEAWTRARDLGDTSPELARSIEEARRRVR